MSYFLNGMHAKDLNKNNTKTKGELALSFGQLIIDLSNCKSKYISPRHFFKTVYTHILFSIIFHYILIFLKKYYR